MSTPPLFQTPCWTNTLTSKLTITADDNIKMISICYVSGTVTISGNASVQGTASSALTMVSAQPIITIGGSGLPIANLVIDASSGNCQVIAYF